MVSPPLVLFRVFLVDFSSTAVRSILDISCTLFLVWFVVVGLAFAPVLRFLIGRYGSSFWRIAHDMGSSLISASASVTLFTILMPVVTARFWVGVSGEMGSVVTSRCWRAATCFSARPASWRSASE